MVCLPDGEKVGEYCTFNRLDIIHERDGRMDSVRRQGPRFQPRGKNCTNSVVTSCCVLTRREVFCTTFTVNYWRSNDYNSCSLSALSLFAKVHKRINLVSK